MLTFPICAFVTFIKPRGDARGTLRLLRGHRIVLMKSGDNVFLAFVRADPQRVTVLTLNLTQVFLGFFLIDVEQR